MATDNCKCLKLLLSVNIINSFSNICSASIELTVSFSNLVHRVTKPSLVLSGVFKEDRAQIKAKLESNGYTVRDRLLVGSQKVSRSINLSLKLELNDFRIAT